MRKCRSCFKLSKLFKIDLIEPKTTFGNFWGHPVCYVLMEGIFHNGCIVPKNYCYGPCKNLQDKNKVSMK